MLEVGRTLAPTRLAVVFGLLLLACGGPDGDDDDVMECVEPPAGPEAPQPDVVVAADVGDSVMLDVTTLFPEADAGAEWSWQQVFGAQEDLEHLSVRAVELSALSGISVTFDANAPGNYGFEVASDAGARYRVDVRVANAATFALDAKGAVFGDVFGVLGTPAFDVSPDNPECWDQVLDHAMAGPARTGLSWVAFVPGAFYSRVRPTPEFETAPELSLEDDAHYLALVEAAHRAGMSVVHIESEAPGVAFTEAQHAELETARLDPVWWDAWFDAWEAWIVPRAARAQAAGVDVFVPFLLADFTFFPDVYPQYGERWREIALAIREVYDGTLAISLSAPDDRFTFADAFDLAFVSFDSGQYTWDPARMADPENPTLDEVIAISEGLLDEAQRVDSMGVPVYLIMQAGSSDGQIGTESIEVRPTLQIDFQEQALYYEGLFAALEDEPWVRGLFTERWDWFDQFDRGGGSDSAIYFDQTIEGSPRSKPAEDVLRLWLAGY